MTAEEAAKAWLAECLRRSALQRAAVLESSRKGLPEGVTWVK